MQPLYAVHLKWPIWAKGDSKSQFIKHDLIHKYKFQYFFIFSDTSVSFHTHQIVIMSWKWKWVMWFTFIRSVIVVGTKALTHRLAKLACSRHHSSSQSIRISIWPHTISIPWVGYTQFYPPIPRQIFGKWMYLTTSFTVL